MTRRLLEICVDTLADARTAIDAGADRIELCGALALGGLTPSAGLAELTIEVAHRAGVRVHAMIRPRDGDFAYTPDELASAIREGEAMLATGVDGLVFGAERGGALDVAALQAFTGAMRRVRSDLALTLHRAVDLLDDPVEAVDAAVETGFTHILSSGGAVRAIDALPVLTAMHERATGRLVVMPGSGVRANNAAAIISATGATELHASASVEGDAPVGKVLELGFATGARRTTSFEEVQALRREMQAV